MFSKAHKIISKIKNSEVRLKWMPSINFYKRTRDILKKKVQLCPKWKLYK